jgi:GNAT superfamily N-acetyltransferase
VSTEWHIEPLGNNHNRSGFSCGIQRLDDFIQHRAGQYERRHLGKTYVAVGEDRRAVIGYYTLAAGSVPFESLPPETARKLPNHPVPVMLLARLAVDSQVQGQHLGETLLIDAFRRSVTISAQLGIHAVQVDAINEKAASFYRRYGFVPLANQPHRLILPISAIAPLLLNK